MTERRLQSVNLLRVLHALASRREALDTDHNLNGVASCGLSSPAKRRTGFEPANSSLGSSRTPNGR